MNRKRTKYDKKVTSFQCERNCGNENKSTEDFKEQDYQGDKLR